MIRFMSSWSKLEHARRFWIKNIWRKIEGILQFYFYCYREERVSCGGNKEISGYKYGCEQQMMSRKLLSYNSETNATEEGLFVFPHYCYCKGSYKRIKNY